jgi:hypothetical protein
MNQAPTIKWSQVPFYIKGNKWVAIPTRKILQKTIQIYKIHAKCIRWWQGA